MKYKNFNLGHVEAVFNKLGGEHGVNRFLSGQSVISPVPKDFPIWRTIKVGNSPDISELMMSGKLDLSENFPSTKGVISVRRLSSELLHSDYESKIYYQNEEEIDLVRLTPLSIGFNSSASAKEIYSWAALLGLNVCLPEVGLQLCLQSSDYQPQYQESSLEEDLDIAMKPVYIPGHDRFPYIFRVRNSKYNGMQLDWNSGEIFSNDRELVFRLPRKK